MNKLKTLIQSNWACLTSVGITDSIPDNEVKYIRFTNVIATLTAIAVFLYIPFSLFKGYYQLAALQTVDAVFVLTVLWCNHLGFHSLSRYTYIVVVNGFVYINSCFIGYESHVHDFFYISYIVPFLLFSVRDYKNIVFGVLVAIGFFYIYNHTYSGFIQYNLDLATQHDINNINLWMKFILFGLAIYILSYYNFSTEAELAATNKKLMTQARELKRSNEDLEQFASIISHDLRAPVRGISGFMTLLRKRYSHHLDASGLEFIELSQNSADRMAKQIEDLLEYSKVGRNLPVATSVDLNTTVKVIQMELGEKFKENNAEIIVDGTLPRLRSMHQSMIHHVFQNLIANGIKFNTNAKPTVTISHTVVGTQCVFHVRDNGIGIDEQYKDKLFQMFKRLHTDTEFEGTGIGLAVCKKIVNFYGGDIWFESEIGQGTSFFFSLPYKEPIGTIFTAKFENPRTVAIAAA
jgi:signal transduction histidine kinase